MNGRATMLGVFKAHAFFFCHIMMIKLVCLLKPFSLNDVYFVTFKNTLLVFCSPSAYLVCGHFFLDPFSLLQFLYVHSSRFYHFQLRRHRKVTLTQVSPSVTSTEFYIWCQFRGSENNRSHHLCFG